LAKIAYHNCEVLRITPWTEEKLILTLLSKEHCLFSALYKIPKKTRHPEKDHFPNLFQSLSGALQFQSEGKHRLRDFDVIARPPSINLRIYTGLCILSRMLQLTLGEHPSDPQAHSLWKMHREGNFDENHWTLLLCDLHYIWGTWPTAQNCEICGSSASELNVQEDKICCSHCRNSHQRLSENLMIWFRCRYRQSSALALDLEDAKLLKRLLWRRLPEQLHGDQIFRRLTRDHFK
jgi:recombinational DNA repair protein (RecF pathway)